MMINVVEVVELEFEKFINNDYVVVTSCDTSLPSIQSTTYHLTSTTTSWMIQDVVPEK